MTTLQPIIANKVVIFKSNDEALSSSTALQDDDELFFRMEANETWQFQFVVFLTTFATPDFKMSINGPGTPSDLRAHAQIWNAAGSLIDIGGVITTYDTPISQTIGSTATSVAYIFGMVQNGSTAGDLALRWAQRVSNGNATVVKKNSHVIARKLVSRASFNIFNNIGAARFVNGVSRALDINGRAWSWGTNILGTLGNNGATGNASSPVAVSGNHSFMAIGELRSALKNDGSIWTWGGNNDGELGDGTVTSRSSPVSVIGSHSFIKITSSSGLKSDGSRWAWGSNLAGQVGDGTIINRSSPVSVMGDHSFIDIREGVDFSFALKANGSVWSWGENGDGQLGDNTIIKKSSPVSVVGNHSFVAIGGGDINHHAMAMKSDGSIWTWGFNSSGQLGNQDPFNANQSSPVSVVGGHSFVSINSGEIHSIALKSDGSAWTWGNNSDGQLGDGMIFSKSSPTSVMGDHSFTNIGGGGFFSMALKSNGSAWTWGRNGLGPLGTGDILPRSSPVSVLGGP